MSEDEYYNECRNIQNEGQNHTLIMPYWNYVEGVREEYYGFKYNILSMTIIQMYCIWDQQKIQYEEDFKPDKILYPREITELELLHNVLKHGEGRSAKKLKKNWPEYFLETELTPYHLYTELNIPTKKVDEFADAIISYWYDLKEKKS